MTLRNLLRLFKILTLRANEEFIIWHDNCLNTKLVSAFTKDNTVTKTNKVGESNHLANKFSHLSSSIEIS